MRKRPGKDCLKKISGQSIRKQKTMTPGESYFSDEQCGESLQGNPMTGISSLNQL
jgi:hypothetical protein